MIIIFNHFPPHTKSSPPKLQSWLLPLWNYIPQFHSPFFIKMTLCGKNKAWTHRLKGLIQALVSAPFFLIHLFGLNTQVNIMLRISSIKSYFAANSASDIQSRWQHHCSSCPLITAGQGHSKCWYLTPTPTHYMSLTACGWRTAVLLLIFYKHSSRIGDS